MLGVLALMRWQSKADSHTDAACSLQNLKVQLVALRDNFDYVFHGVQLAEQKERSARQELFLKT